MYSTTTWRHCGTDSNLGYVQMPNSDRISDFTLLHTASGKTANDVAESYAVSDYGPSADTASDLSRTKSNRLSDIMFKAKVDVIYSHLLNRS